MGTNLRVGFGYDIHRIVAGRGLRLGGVPFPRARFSLQGHSDADVILHALCDALLGAAGLPDIGRQFPNTSPRNRGRNSLEFLKQVGVKLRQKGFQPVNLDCTLLAQTPHIAAAVPRMCQQIARTLGIVPEQVQIKATTLEGLGALGRQEGLAACAVALVEKTSL